jgi:GT2 family glycosyltransferase
LNDLRDAWKRWSISFSDPSQVASNLLVVLAATLAAPWIGLGIALATAANRFQPGRIQPSLRSGTPGRSASIIMLNWNGLDFLQAAIPSVVSAVRADGSPHQILVVDNGSTDQSVAWLRAHFPTVEVLCLPRNLHFARGNNLGVFAARYDLVVLLNNDMVVDQHFLRPLLDALDDPNVFASTSQIFFRDASRRREETGLTRGRFRHGHFQLQHAPIEANMRGDSLAVLWAGGGSSAFDRHKFRQLGGFDPLYHPFYVEDLDLSYRAWKRGWRCVFVPESVVHHEHRGTTRRTYGDAFIQNTIRKNELLFVWRNVTDWRMLTEHLLWLPLILVELSIREGWAQTLRAFARALRQLPEALWKRGMDGAFVLSDRQVLARTCAPG